MSEVIGNKIGLGSKERHLKLHPSEKTKLAELKIEAYMLPHHYTMNEEETYKNLDYALRAEYKGSLILIHKVPGERWNLSKEHHIDLDQFLRILESDERRLQLLAEVL